MQPNTTTPQSNTGEITPPLQTPAVGAQADQVAAQNLAVNPFVPAPVTPITPEPAPAFNFNVPELPTVNYVDPSKYNSLLDLAGAQNSNYAGLMNQQSALERGVFNQYQQAISSQGSALDRYNKLAAQMNIPMYQQQMQTIQGLLNRLSDNLDTRAQGTFMTQAQRDQLEAVEGKSLRNQLAPIAQAQTTAESNLSRMMDYYSQDAERQLDPLRTYLSNLGSSFGRQLTGLSGANEGNLSALKDKKDRERDAENEAFNRRMQEADLDIKRRSLSLQERAAKLGFGDDFGGGGKGTTSITPAQAIAGARNYATQQKQQMLKNGGVQPFAREAVLNAIKSQYTGLLSEKEMNDLVYKELFPDNWAGGLSSGQKSSLMGRLGYGGVGGSGGGW